MTQVRIIDPKAKAALEKKVTAEKLRTLSIVAADAVEARDAEIRRLRLEEFWSLRELAVLVGVSHPTIVRICRS